MYFILCASSNGPVKQAGYLQPRHLHWETLGEVLTVARDRHSLQGELDCPLLICSQKLTLPVTLEVALSLRKCRRYMPAGRCQREPRILLPPCPSDRLESLGSVALVGWEVHHPGMAHMGGLEGGFLCAQGSTCHQSESPSVTCYPVTASLGLPRTKSDQHHPLHRLQSLRKDRCAHTHSPSHATPMQFISNSPESPSFIILIPRSRVHTQPPGLRRAKYSGNWCLE